MEIKRELRSFLAEEDGVGVIEVVLILVGRYITSRGRILCKH